MGKKDKSFHDRLANLGAPKKKRSEGSFSKKLSDGTTIFGPKSTEGRPGHKHGHKGSNFHRSPHSTIGSAAIGRSHTQKGHRPSVGDDVRAYPTLAIKLARVGPPLLDQ